MARFRLKYMTVYEALQFFIQMAQNGVVLGIVIVGIFHLPKWNQ